MWVLVASTASSWQGSSDPHWVDAEKYLARVVCVALPSAMAAAFLFMIALKLGASLNGAGFAAMSLGHATPLWCYATLFW